MVKRIKVIFLDYDVRYINPTRNLLPELLQQACEVYPFGPGYTTEDDLAKGVEAFIDRLGGVDLVVATEHVLFWTSKVSVRQYRRNYMFNFTQAEVGYTHLMQQFFRRWKGPKVSLLLESDFWNFTPEQIDRLETFGGIYAGWGKDVASQVGELVERVPEVFKNLTNCWYEFVDRNSTRVATILHYISSMEVIDKQLKDRHKDWSILGASYLSRQMARQRLSESQIPWDGRIPMLKMKVYSRLMRTGLFPRSWAIDTINSGFRGSLIECKYGFTCGSYIRGPIRKFFEIPAAGQVLVCEPFKGASGVGFLDRETMLISRPEDILDVNEWLAKHPEDAQVIADKGREMIKKKHSLSARAQQLKSVFNAIFERKFNGGRWIDGEFTLLE